MSVSARDRHIVVGRVQGVGFRPFVYRLALSRGLTGFVLNSPEGVIIEVQGGQPELDGFARDLIETLPPLAMIVSHSRESVPAAAGEGAFVIAASAPGLGHHVLVSPDVATCPDCLADMADKGNRRHLYPFTNCTNCGPRYTITASLPYDRPATTMACFPMCPECLREYEDPLDRRFHAQPNACPVCGPRVWLADRKGRRLAEGGKAVERAAKALAAGKILALKGLGGFHLAANALDHAAVTELRRRKRRPSKPLGVMVPDIETLSRFAAVGPEEADMLAGRERPIVLAGLKPGSGLAEDISPDTDQLGAMLPYTPLHHVLLGAVAKASGGPAVLVMTSGNLSSEPISLGNREALARLGAIADLFLLHDRDILVRTDDSVVRFTPAPGSPDESARQPAGEASSRDSGTRPPLPAPGGASDAGSGPRAGEAASGAFVERSPLPAPGGPLDRPPARLQFLRRARGFTPSPVFLAKAGPSVLGVGPELKNTLCLTKDDQAFVSQHVGDMRNLETAAFHKEAAAHLTRILQVAPEAVVADKHPDYLSTRYALEESGLPVIRLQHHFAHVFAMLAEKRLAEPVLGLALDGSGHGDDGAIWGGEILYAAPSRLELVRAGHFRPVGLPGGEAAIRQPWRMAVSYLDAAGLDPLSGDWPWLAGREQAAALVLAMIAKGVNSPSTSSCGRLFDAVSALCGVCGEISYEGQAAIRLEHALDPAEPGRYACPLGADGVLDTVELFRQAASDALRGAPAPVVSARFHAGLARGLAEAAAALGREYGTRRVALTGGVFLNRTLSRLVEGHLLARGLTPLVHELVPPGDGCVSLGQAYYGQLLLARG